MFIAQAPPRTRAFTLLEIMLAVGILSMMSLAIYRFVQANIVALRISSTEVANNAQYTGLVNLLTTHLQSLAPGRAALSGEPFKFEGRPRDEITWITGAGPGVLTRHATGDFVVTMRIKPAAKGSNRMELGFNRKVADDKAAAERETWIALMQDVQSLQIRYFDPRLNSWVERWTDTLILPRLVKFTIGRSDNATPFEAIVALARTPL